MSAVLMADAAWMPVETVRLPATGRLRCFGNVVEERSAWTNGAGRIACRRFKAGDAAQASAIAGKLAADVKTTDGVRIIKVGDLDALATASGQAILIALDGAECRVLASPDAAALTSLVAAYPELARGATVNAGYPVYLDAFGYGLYGVGGTENMHDWMRHGDAGVKDPVEDLEWLKKEGYRFDTFIKNSGGMDAGEGLADPTSGDDWKITWADKLGLTYGHRLYITDGGSDWTDRKLGDYKDKPAWFMLRGWHRNWEFRYFTDMHFTWYSEDIMRYLANATAKLMRKYDGPNATEWMNPFGELAHGDMWYDMHADYGRFAEESWRRFLKARGVTLAAASRMYKRGASPFMEWAQVPVPEFAMFAGLSESFQSLKGTWAWKTDFAGNPTNKADFLKLPWKERYQGEREAWWKENLDVSGWGTLEMPGDERMYFTASDQNRDGWRSSWFRRTFDYDPAKVHGGRAFLYFFPMTGDGTVSAEETRRHRLYLNGAFVSEVGAWCALDVTDRLKPGPNQITIHLMGGRWDGRIFLSAEKPAIYPDLGADRNRLWELWGEWRADAKQKGWEIVLDAMRQADPDKPIKYMAPINFGTDRWMDLCRKYGGRGHFTGEGIWYFPWYKRYGKVYDIPGTSESAGPENSPEQLFANYRRVFAAGLDGHEPVFLAQTYTRNPELRTWWEGHRTILHRMGKYDIAGPQVLIYRHAEPSAETIAPYPLVGKAARKPQSYWNWDLGRGTLQTIGQSYLYIDNASIEDGKISDYPVTIDCGNETMTPEIVAGLVRYVEKGGTFVTLPFTGRNSGTAQDVWPIAALTGCAYAERKTGGDVVFEKNARVVAGYAGRSVKDDGRCVDCNLNNLNESSFELSVKEGTDAEVIARYKDGKPAIVVRTLGRGRVVVLGTAFWRDAQDLRGVWWPGAKETGFVAALLKGLGFSESEGDADDPLVWTQPYRSNDGLERITMAVNWHDEGTVKPRFTLRFDSRPGRLYAYTANAVKDVPFTWDENRGTATVTDFEIPAKEVVLFAAENHSAADAIDYWWEHLCGVWAPIKEPSDFEYAQYDEGPWASATMELREDATFTNDTPPENWTAADYDDSKWKPTNIGFLRAWGAKTNAAVWVRKTFDVPYEKLGNGQVRLTSGAWIGQRYLAPTRMILNGTELHGFVEKGFYDIDVSALLKPGRNVLCFEQKGGVKNQGFNGYTFLFFRGAPEKSYDLSGAWCATKANGSLFEMTIPCTRVRAVRPTKKFFIPKEWEDKHIRLFLKGEPGCLSGMTVNNRTVRRHHHRMGPWMDLDVTRVVRFGEENTIEIFTELQKEAALTLEMIRLEVFSK